MGIGGNCTLLISFSAQVNDTTSIWGNACCVQCICVVYSVSLFWLLQLSCSAWGSTIDKLDEELKYSES